MADDSGTVHPIDQAVYDSYAPRVATCGTRYGHGACTILWIKANDNGWVLLPHGMPNLAVHLPAEEFITMLTAYGTGCDRRRDTRPDSGAVSQYKDISRNGS